jgi:hypothetical protein
MSCPANGLNGTVAKLSGPPGNKSQSILRMQWVCPEDVCGPVQSQGGGYPPVLRHRHSVCWFQRLGIYLGIAVVLTQ